MKNGFGPFKIMRCCHLDSVTSVVVLQLVQKVHASVNMFNFYRSWNEVNFYKYEKVAEK